jgi:hypothetical protein
MNVLYECDYEKGKMKKKMSRVEVACSWLGRGGSARPPPTILPPNHLSVFPPTHPRIMAAGVRWGEGLGC